MKRWSLVLLATTVVAGCGGESETADYDEAARNLAVIDGEGDADLEAVKQRSGALDVLVRKCPHVGRSKLSDYATVAKQQIKKEGGQDLSTLTIMRGLNKAMAPALVGKQKCTDVLAAYIVVAASDQP